MNESPVCSNQDTLRLLAEVERLDELARDRNITTTNLNREIGQLKFQMGTMKSALLSAQSIIENSYGVSGWHMNGDVATWGELGLHDEIASVLAGEAQ